MRDMGEKNVLLWMVFCTLGSILALVLSDLLGLAAAVILTPLLLLVCLVAYVRMTDR